MRDPIQGMDSGRSLARRTLRTVFVVITVLAAGCGFDVAQETSGETVDSKTSRAEAKDVGPRSPRGAVQAFLDASAAGRYDEAARYLDLSETDAKAGPTLARHFAVVLDQKLWFDLDRLSPLPEGEAEDGLPTDLESVGVIDTPQGEVDIVMARTGGSGIWRFSAATVGRIPALYEMFGYGALGEVLPESFFTIQLLHISLWQWTGLLVSVFVAYILSWVAVWAIHRVVRVFVSRTDTQLDDMLLDITVKPLRLVLAAAFFHVIMLVLRLAAPPRAFLGTLVQALLIVTVTWFLLRLVDGFRSQVQEHLVKEGKQGAVAVIPLGVKTVKVILVLLSAVAMLQHFGFNVTGVIAGLGVGGIALALAAQKTIENLFGGVTLIADQPVRVGDFCRFGDKIGTVEDVGLRSTRVRTLDRTVVSVPNAEFAQIQIENFGPRDRVRLFCTIGLRYETTPDQLRHVLTGLRRLLISHPRVTPDPARVRFVGFGAYSLDVEVFAYVGTSDWSEFLSIREDIFLRMMDTISESGTGFAFPSTTTYLSRDHGLDEKRARDAERTVERWREESTLPFPSWSPEAIAEVEDSLDFPPRGSMAGGRSA